MKDYIELKNGQKWKLNTAYEGDCLDFMKELPDKSVGLIMADPPYFEVKGEFDFIWDSFDDYLKDVEKWAIECKRILADNGSLFWWGHAKKIAYSQIILDKYFNLGNSLVWEKKECQTKAQDFEQARHFAPITERCLFYTNEVEYTGLEELMNNPAIWKPIKDYLLSEYCKSGLTIRTANKLMGLATTGANLAGEMFGTKRLRFCFPTKEKYECLQKTGYFQKEYEDLRAEYEDLRAEYEDLRRPFNNKEKLTDVILHSQESHISRQYNHETIKAAGLIKRLLQTTTRKDTIVFSPFLGSWTDAVVCYELGLKWFGCESNHQHFVDGLERYETECLQNLFDF